MIQGFFRFPDLDRREARRGFGDVQHGSAIAAVPGTLPGRVRRAVRPWLARGLPRAPIDDRGDAAAALRGHRRRQRLGDGVVDHFDRLQRRPAIEEARRRRQRVEHGARAGQDLDGSEMPLMRRLAIAGEHADRDAARRDRGGYRAVDGAGLRLGDMGKIEAHIRALDLDRDLERDRVVGDAVRIHLAAADIAPVRNGLEIGAHDALAMVEHRLDGMAERLAAEAAHHFLEARGADAAADHLRVEVAGDEFRHAAIGDDHAVDVVVQLAALVDLHARIDRAFLEHVDRIGAVGILAGDIQPMALDRRVADQFAVLKEDGIDHGEVLRVRARAIGPIVHDHVAGEDVRRAADILHPPPRRRN